MYDLLSTNDINFIIINFGSTCHFCVLVFQILLMENSHMSQEINETITKENYIDTLKATRTKHFFFLFLSCRKQMW